MNNKNQPFIPVIGTLLLLTILFLPTFLNPPSDPPTATHLPSATCLTTPTILPPTTPWQFRFDPDNIGLDQAWYASNHDTSQWDQSAPGIPWETQGYPEYDGFAWYRAQFTIPADWTTAYLGTNQVDDVGRIWINGQEQPFANLITLPTGGTVTIAYQIEDKLGLGGIKQPVIVASHPWAVQTGGDYVRNLADRFPSWPMPNWAQRAPNAWTMSGALNNKHEALISNQPAIMPHPDAPITELYFHQPDQDPATIHQPTNVQFSLLDNTLPIPQTSWNLGPLTLNTTYFTDFNDGGVYWQLTITATESVSGTFGLLTRPFALHNDRQPIYAASQLSNGLWLNNHHYQQASPAPDHVTIHPLLPNDNTIHRLITADFPPQTDWPCSPDGDLAINQAYHLQLNAGQTEQFTFTYAGGTELTPPDPASATKTLALTRLNWQKTVDQPHLDLPDGRIMNAYQASIAYLLIAFDPSGPRPGPMDHDAIWMRDAAYIGETVLKLGRDDLVRQTLPTLVRHQAPNGYLPAIIRDGVPLPDEEWDAQGQLIFLIAETYRYTGDEQLLRTYYPNIISSARFIQELRQRTANDPPVSNGILPPSRSAEDLGPAEWHHYWDTLWAITGLREAANIATILNQPDDARWLTAEADALDQSLRLSITAVMGDPAPYIPNGPEDITSSAMARGSSNTLYPLELFDRDDPLIQRSFNHYYAQFIEPYNGAYKHIFEQYWPYGGMGLARDYLRLGRQDILHQILGWSLSNETLPGTYAWAEQVSPVDGGFSGGSMPHAWAASSYITLIDEMLVMRDENSLELLAGAPPSWLTAGQTITIDQMPTPFGPLTLRTDSTLTIDGDNWQGTITLTLDGAPPDGYKWRLEREPTTITNATYHDGWLHIPPTTTTVILNY
ncbi:MAG TPA: hypothetical protein VLL52_18550 [Anaerolineae bacterium]|nr:hypothetical protein [Anaerolineae bacterium]